MILPQFIHSIVLLSITLFTYYWNHEEALRNYNLQLTAIVILVYFLLRFLNLIRFQSLQTSFLTFLVLILVFSTGSVNSPFLFILDFLLITVALFFESFQAALVAFVLVVLFLIEVRLDPNTIQAVNIIALCLTAPVAFIFGRKFLELKQARGEITLLQNTLKREETDTLFWLSQAKPTLVDLIDTTSQIIASNSLPFRLQEKIKQTHKNLLDLHQSVNALEKELD